MTDSIARFVANSRKFCTWIDGLPSQAGGVADLQQLRLLLADLHASFLRLPDGFDVDAPDPNESPSVERLEREQILRGLPFNYYREMYDPFTNDEPVLGSLSDDLSDIYSDLQEGLDIFDAGYPIGAAWQWRFHFQSHWGEHLTGAQRAIHWWFARCDDAIED